jgi:HYDIN/CFA65/VesB family protein
MKQKITILVVLLALSLPALGRSQEKQSEQPPGAPKLVVDKVTHDFGIVRPGTQLRHSFTVRNIGTTDLLIKSVSPG